MADGRILLVKSGGEAAMPEWRAAFAAAAPHLDVRWWDDPAVDPADVAYVMVWEPEPGRLATYPNLRLICSPGAGVDSITADPSLPRHLPILRMGGAEPAQRMGEYVALAALALLRGLKRIVDAQAARRWDYFDAPRTAPQTRAGIMGLGNLGLRSAEMLRDIGFVTAGWSATPKRIAGVESFAGSGALDAFLARTDILVCLLPDTEQTRGMLNGRLFATLPPGAAVVNAARGKLLVLPDLVAALDSGHLSGAVLDVFDPEPLPPDHPVWAHPRIIVTPHLASLASRPARARFVAQAIAAFERGEPLPTLYDTTRGY